MDEKKRDIYDVASGKLARSQKTEYQLTTELKKLGYSSEEIEDLVRDYREWGYLDDANYAAAYFRYGRNKGWADARIDRELRKRGVSPEDISAGIAEEDQEPERAYLVASKMVKAGDINQGRLEEKVKARIGRKLYSYGYGAGIIYQVINRLERENS